MVAWVAVGHYLLVAAAYLAVAPAVVGACSGVAQSLEAASVGEVHCLVGVALQAAAVGAVPGRVVKAVAAVALVVAVAVVAVAVAASVGYPLLVVVAALVGLVA